MPEPPEPPVKAAPGKGRNAGRRKAFFFVVLGLVALSSALYRGLFSGLRLSSGSSDEEASTSATGKPGVLGTSLMRDEVEFQRRRQAEAERRGKAVDEMVRQFGRSSVSYLRPGAATDASGRLKYDDVGGAAGRSIRGILRPKESRKRPNAIVLDDSQLKSGLKDLGAASVIPGELKSAGKAQDIAPTATGAERIGPAEPPRESSPLSDAGLMVIGLPARERRVVNQGGIDAAPGTADETKAVNADPGMVRETLESTDVPPTAPTLTSAGGGKAWKGLKAFKPNDAVQKSVQAIESGKPTETQMSKLTSAHVYGRQGGGQGLAQEPAAELGGVVFDGKEPPTERVSGLSEASVGDAGAGNLHHEAAEQLEGDLKTCLKERAITERKQMSKLKDLGKEVRTAVVEVRDALFSCSQRHRSYLSCLDRPPPRDCSGPRNSWMTSKKIYQLKMKAALNKEVATLVSECEGFNKMSGDAGKECRISRTEAMDYACSDLKTRPEGEMKICLVPFSGEKCTPGCF